VAALGAEKREMRVETEKALELKEKSAKRETNETKEPATTEFKSPGEEDQRLAEQTLQSKVDETQSDMIDQLETSSKESTDVVVPNEGVPMSSNENSPTV